MFLYLFPPGTGYPSYTPGHWVYGVEVEVTLQLTVGQSVSQSVCLGFEHPCGTYDQILLPVSMFLSENCDIVSVGRPLWREDESACSCSHFISSARTAQRTSLTVLLLLLALLFRQLPSNSHSLHYLVTTTLQLPTSQPLHRNGRIYYSF
jgi:hypothetical protein